MLGPIIILLLLLYVFRKKGVQTPWRRSLVVVLFNVFVIEGVVYVYLLTQVFSGNSLFLIGNQTILDHLIKMQIVDAMYVRPATDNAFYQVHPDLGYTVGRSKEFLRYRSSAQGLRADKEYTLIPPPDKLRMATFGDSFVFCDGELNKNTWQSFLEQTVDNVEVLNFGVSGYGLGASYLRYLKDGLQFSPDIVFFNYVETGIRDLTKDDPINEGTNLKTSTMCRPIFEIKNNILVNESLNPLNFLSKEFRDKHVYDHLGLNPVEQLLTSRIVSISNTALLLKTLYLQKKYAHFVKRENKKSIEYNLLILNNIIQIARHDHATVVFVSGEFMNLPMPIKKILKDNEDDVIYINMPRLIDQAATRLNLDTTKMYNVSNHYNALGNRFYAELIATVLKGKEWGEGDRRFRYDPTTKSFINIGRK